MNSSTCTPAFRAEAVKLVLAQGLTKEEAEQRIVMSQGALANSRSAGHMWWIKPRFVDATAENSSR